MSGYRTVSIAVHFSVIAESTVSDTELADRLLDHLGNWDDLPAHVFSVDGTDVLR